MTPLGEDDFYLESGKFVLTERYHLRRGHCCGNGCRHCPFDHEAVPEAIRSQLPPPYPYFLASPRTTE